MREDIYGMEILRQLQSTLGSGMPFSAKPFEKKIRIGCRKSISMETCGFD
jgi:hypothetical protein